MVEIALAEEDAARFRLGQAVSLRARSLPLRTLQDQVDRITTGGGARGRFAHGSCFRDEMVAISRL